ncbi:MAG: glycosyltransferase, partial [Halothiobacillaceae bacterium]
QGQLAQTQEAFQAIMQSRSWRVTAPLRILARKLRRLRSAAFFALSYYKEQGGGRHGITRLIITALQGVRNLGIMGIMRKAAHYGQIRRSGVGFVSPLGLSPILADHCGQPAPHVASVDIIVCVHNALDDVRACLNSILNHTSKPYRIIIVDDGSADDTSTYLRQFVEDHVDTSTVLLRNENATGYTLAANRGLRASSAEFVVLLNSDTVVSQEWLDRLIRCAQSHEKVGIVGPLSNTASWQSIPAIEHQGDWAENPLPHDVSVHEMAQLVADHSSCLYPLMSFLNGFCLVIKRTVIEDIGYFDEDSFAQGYGEENDYCLRARKAGWMLALADDVYVYHAQSKSYSSERRKRLSERAGLILEQKHGAQMIAEGVDQCRYDRVLEGIRARAGILFERRSLVQQVRQRWGGKRLVFVLPVSRVGGGANVVITEARALKAMGVDVSIVNLEPLREGFISSYPSLDIPVFYASSTDHVAALVSQLGADAVIATLNTSVYWLKPLVDKDDRPLIGYYVQDFEPYFYDDTQGFEVAKASYSLIKDMVCFTKTAWNRDEVLRETGVECSLIGPSVDISLFQPRPRVHPSWPQRPLRVCAMIRPSSPRRGARLTMEVLSQCATKFGDAIEIILFGTEAEDPDFQRLPHNFPFRLFGLQRSMDLASLFNEVDIFVDFSSFQAMGLTAMEAMACGVAVIVPSKGGATSFARDRENALVIDTASRDECVKALELLITNHQLRHHIQQRALRDIVQFFPERCAFNMMNALFS